MKNIVLLGGSNSVMVNGLQKGLREYANVTNLALGGTTSIQNLYELYRPKNQEAIKNADLIITESNINDIDHHLCKYKQFSLDNIFEELFYLYTKLYLLHKPICIIILPLYYDNYRVINNMHRFLVNYYGFNIVDVNHYYEENSLVEFGKKFSYHQMNVVSRNIGKGIAKNIDKFKASDKVIENIYLPEFKVLTPQDMKRFGDFKIFNPKNSVFNEVVYRLEVDNYLSFKGYEEYRIIGIHSWNLNKNGDAMRGFYSAADNGRSALVSIYDMFNSNLGTIETPTFNIFCHIKNEINITSNLIVKSNKDNFSITESHMFSWIPPNDTTLPYFDLIAFFLCKPNPKMKLFDLSIIPSDMEIEIDKDIDRSYLIPNLVFFKDSMEFIDEYIGHLYPNITKHIDSVLTPQIINKTKSELTPPAPKPTPQPTPQELEIKSLKEALSKKEKDISSLEINYQKALNTKNHLSYKLGQALIKANKNWYKGGYIKFIFEVMRIKKEHRK